MHRSEQRLDRCDSHQVLHGIGELRIERDQSVCFELGQSDVLRAKRVRPAELIGDPGQVRAVAAQLRAGQVIVNSGYPDLTAPFGGYKQSGNGRVWGLAGLEEYLETKAVVSAP